jgi:hypothetical protein
VKWFKDGVPQHEVEVKEEVDSATAEEDAVDRHVAWIMADAKKAQDKRDRACKQAWSRS